MVDIPTIPGLIFLMHKERSVIDQDYAQIREIETNGLFEVT